MNYFLNKRKKLSVRKGNRRKTIGSSGGYDHNGNYLSSNKSERDPLGSSYILAKENQRVIFPKFRSGFRIFNF